MAERCAPLRDQVASAKALQDLAESLLDSPDGGTWLEVVTRAAG